jgi:ribonuclease HI
MEGQPWATSLSPPLPPSAYKEMQQCTRQNKSYQQQHHQQHTTKTGTGNSSFLKKTNTSNENEDFVSSQRNENNDVLELRLSPEKNYSLRVKGHTTTRSGGAGIGLILEDSCSNQTVWSARLYVSGDRTPFEAEYSAIILGMDYACNILKTRRLTVFTSNGIIVNQIQGIFVVTKSTLGILLETIQRIQRQFQRQLSHVRIEESPPTDDSSTSEATVQAMKALATRKSLNINDKDWKVERKDPMQKLRRDPLKMGRWRKPDDPAQSTIIDPNKLYRLQFDGGAREHVGAGMVLYDDDGTEIWCGWHFHPEAATNNVAEYMGLVCGLRCARSLGITKLVVEGDSLLVVQQMMGKYQSRERELDVFRDEAHVLIKDLSYFQIRYIPRAENRRADWLANHAMNLKESHGFTRIEVNDNPILTGRNVIDQAAAI